MSVSLIQNLSPQRTIDPCGNLRKRKADDYSAAGGPSPDRIVSIRSIPDTETRVNKRAQRMLSLCSDEGRETFEVIKSKIEKNPQLATLLKNQVLQKRISLVHSAKQKKCFTIAQVILFQKNGKELVSIGEKLITKNFWSSSKEYKNDLITCTGLSGEIRSSYGKASPNPMVDHHSERACVMWIAERTSRVCEKIIDERKLPREGFVWHDKIVHINMVTKFSSCRNCIAVFGQEDNFQRIPEEIKRKFSLAQRIDPSAGPSVTILHQGLRHHHPGSKQKTRELPLPEFYCTRSLLEAFEPPSWDL